MPYLINRVAKLAGTEVSNKFSPWGLVSERNVTVQGRVMKSYEITGISQLDYIELFKKFGYSYGNQASYKLDHIANVVLGEKKLSYEEHGNLHTLYKNDHQLFIDYNIKAQISFSSNDNFYLISYFKFHLMSSLLQKYLNKDL
jgi:hypothetical protein